MKRITDYVADQILESSPDAKAEEVWTTPNIHHETPQTWEEELESIRAEFRETFHRRTIHYLAICSVSLALLYGADSYLVEGFPKQGYGLLLDLIGAIILGRGLLKGKYSILLEVHNRNAGRELYVVPDKVADAVDGFWGITLLIIGIVGQGVAIILV